jgi:hypothetical protein
MLVYGTVCRYMHVFLSKIYAVKYMHIHRVRISDSISGRIFVCISNSVENALCLCPLGLCPMRTVSAPSPRGRYGKFVTLQRKRRQIATFNQIRSARLNSGSHRQAPATCTSAAPLLRAEVP